MHEEKLEGIRAGRPPAYRFDSYTDYNNIQVA